MAASKSRGNALTVYGIPNCDTVKKARDWLDAHGVTYAFHDVKKAGVDAALLRGWLAQVPLDTLVNRRGTTWRALSDEQKAAAGTTDGAIALMIDKPSVIKRPVVVADDGIKAVGFSADQYQTLF
ncbi:ArsC family reductase [Mycetohabitans sp. B5]|uniref:Spx/MgsR family transcriptional regulator n=1 Tax=Mycetohabitans endofungorum TaxID=417203 RepID=A0A2P5KBY6_9BURK|nr:MULTISPECIES: ArsC family reductase [Mycetohabitans]MCG1054481.1 ArsC family reductase [Mycetohabitans sp. B5]PPB84201.1 Spx/MgsR family transcriptional regulator [Mycetohabitans endofungorum]